MNGHGDDAAGRLCLGTAQLGLDYGIANTAGALAEPAAEALLEAAWQGGIRWFDTARAYGEAEARLGRWLRARGRAPHLVTKLAPVESAAGVAAGLDAATAALGRRPDIVLAHRGSDITRPAVAGALAEAVAAGRISAFGASVYSPDEARRALAVAGIGALQLPLSLADRRALDQGVIDQACARGVRLLARSVFLQGALVMPAAALPEHLAALRAPLSRLARIADEAGCTVAALALAGVLTVGGVDWVVIGAERPEQIAADLAAAARPPGSDAVEAAIAALAALPLAVLEPPRWRQGAPAARGFG